MKQANEGYDMNVKRYVAEDMRQALKQIREELGPDAVILSNRRVEGGVEIITSADTFPQNAASGPAMTSAQKLVDKGVDSIGSNRRENNRVGNDRLDKPLFSQGGLPEDSFPEDRVELSTASTASVNRTLSAVGASDIPQTQPKEAASPTRRSAVRQRRYIEDQLSGSDVLSASGQAQIDDTFEHLLGQYSSPAAGKSQQDEPGQPERGQNGNGQLVDAMRSEIESLRLLLKDQMEHTSDDRWALKNPLEAAVKKRLVTEGISDRLARKLVSNQEHHNTIEEAWNAALKDLAASIPTLGRDSMGKTGVIALLGATGVGKTTTIAKLAVRYALKYGPDQLALVTTDSYRLAAYEQLRTLGRIIDVPVRQVDEHNSLEDVLQSLKHKSMVLIDTAGFHLGDKNRLQQLELLNQVEKPIKKLLVLPSTSQSKVLQSAYELMAKVKLDGCVLSKIDETSSLGEVLSLVVEKELPVAYITNGQKIPNDLGKACPEELVKGLNRVQPVSRTVVNDPYANIRKPVPVFAGQYA